MRDIPYDRFAKVNGPTFPPARSDLFLQFGGPAEFAPGRTCVSIG